MDRLTTRDKHGVAVMRLDLPAGIDRSPVARLAAYEDTGLAPEEIAALKEERDAVVALLYGNCLLCGNYTGITNETCDKCTMMGGTEKNWEWRGPKNENAEGAEACQARGIPKETLAVMDWVGRDAWVLGEDIDTGEEKVFKGHVTSVCFGRNMYRPKKTEVEVEVGEASYLYAPENVFLTLEDAEVALAQLQEREDRG